MKLGQGRKKIYLTEDEQDDAARKTKMRWYWRQVAKKKRLQGDEAGARRAEKKLELYAIVHPDALAELQGQ